MKFYKELSKVYDIVFPKDEDTMSFLCDGLKVNSKILDLACGTGTYSIALAQKGHRVEGIDLGKEMIEIAKSKGGLFANFMEGDMTKFKDISSHGNYDFIFCIGNSIVHLQNKDKIQRFINDIYSMLSSGASAVIQIINYDRIIKDNVDSLPTIDRSSKGVIFIRKYIHKESDSKIEFNTELIINHNGEEKRLENSVDLIALQSQELRDMLTNAGFNKIEFFGDFNKEDFTDESMALVAKAYK